MARTHNLGFPRIGSRRELKFALESYWQGDSGAQQLDAGAAKLRRQNWARQRKLDLVPVGEFSLYDHVLDTSFLLGNVPERFAAGGGSELDRYFRAARGRAPGDAGTCCLQAAEMTKWFDTNYHYIVPEVTADTAFRLNPQPLLDQVAAAREQGIRPKPVILGPLTYLWLCKEKDQSRRLDLLERLLPVYAELLCRLARLGCEWVQVDEPALVLDLDRDWKVAFEQAYHALKSEPVRILLTTYFGSLQDNLQLACNLPVAGLHVDIVSAGFDEITRVVDWLPAFKILSLGIIDGRNIWKSDLNGILDRLEPVAAKLQDRLWLAPSCSLLHVPVDLAGETALDPELRDWLAFAVQKLDELEVIARALNEGRAAVAGALRDNASAIAARRASTRVHDRGLRERLANIPPGAGQRHHPYEVRARLQRARLQLPPYPTTTIGSFPQTAAIRNARQQFRQGTLGPAEYRQRMLQEIEQAVRTQEALGLDVLVHGEAERNDMVEYFGEQLAGYAISRHGWVQSYGSRCVKPPILYGDIRRTRPMTVDWIRHAQSLTDKPVKGMLTGPVTMLNWSFVRDDQPLRETCMQLALAIRDEVLDLEAAGIRIIQIDEAALREGLPLRRADWNTYLDWAVEAFRISANGVGDETQIHTHMCYSEFNDIIEQIARLDADVITIETSRSDMELLDAFDAFHYPNEIGPGVYDIHSPNIPAASQIVDLVQCAAKRIPAQRLWINPDCGLKTRRWEEVQPALENMVHAARTLRGMRHDAEV